MIEMITAKLGVKAAAYAGGVMGKVPKAKKAQGGKIKYDNGGDVKETLATLQRLNKSPEEIDRLMKNRAAALKEYETTKPTKKSLSQMKFGSAERIAEYKRRGWAMDETTGGPDPKTKPKNKTKWGKQVEKPGTKPVKPTVPFTDDTLPEDADITYDEKFIPKMPGDDKFTLLSQKDQSKMSADEQKGYLKEKRKYQARLDDKYKKEDRQEKISKVKKKVKDTASKLYKSAFPERSKLDKQLSSRGYSKSDMEFPPLTAP